MKLYDIGIGDIDEENLEEIELPNVNVNNIEAVTNFTISGLHFTEINIYNGKEVHFPL